MDLLYQEVSGLVEVLVELVGRSIAAYVSPGITHAAVECAWSILLESVEKALKRAHQQVLVDFAKLFQDVDGELEANIEANLGPGITHAHSGKRIARWNSPRGLVGPLLRHTFVRQVEDPGDVIKEVLLLLVVELLPLEVDAVQDVDLLCHDLAVVPAGLVLGLLRDQEVLVVLGGARVPGLLRSRALRPPRGLIARLEHLKVALRRPKPNLQIIDDLLHGLLDHKRVNAGALEVLGVLLEVVLLQEVVQIDGAGPHLGLDVLVDLLDDVAVPDEVVHKVLGTLACRVRLCWSGLCTRVHRLVLGLNVVTDSVVGE